MYIDVQGLALFAVYMALGILAIRLIGWALFWTLYGMICVYWYALGLFGIEEK